MTDGSTKIQIISAATSKLNSELESLISSVLGSPVESDRWDGNVLAEIPEPSDEMIDRIKRALPNVKFSADITDRFWNSIGKSSYEILLLRSGILPPIVSCVLFPDDTNVASVLPALKDAKVSAVIHGGGTSVTGGLRRKRAEKRVAIDCRELDRIKICHGYVTVGSGVRGIHLEETLNSHGMTAGHFPESLKGSSVGGWIAAMSSGQESNEYGDIENIVMGLDLFRSDFGMRDPVVPRESTGLSAKSLALGGEGLTGLIGRVNIRIHPLPHRRSYGSFAFRDFKSAIDFLSSHERFPTVVRVSDERETAFLIASAGENSSKRILRRYLRLRSLDPYNFSLMIFVDNHAMKWKGHGSAISLGGSLARMWESSRFGRPEIGDEIWKLGYVPDTLETSVPWDKMQLLYVAVNETFMATIKELGLTGIIMAHISHLYAAGGALYFTIILDRNTRPEGLMKVRDNMVSAFVANGGSISHHHGIGTYFTKHLSPEKVKLFKLLEDPVLADD